MPHRRLAASIFAVLAPFAFTGCSDQSPIAPDASLDGGQNVTPLAELAVGTYLLTVYATSVGRGAVLDAFVRDASGNPATNGTAVFYYCSRQGAPAPRGRVSRDRETGCVMAVLGSFRLVLSEDTL